MTFKHKLAARLARMRRVSALLALAVFGAASCTDNPVAGPTGSFPAVSASLTIVHIGDRVKTTGTANVRSGPKASATQVGTQPIGALGTVLGGPIIDSTGDKLTRYNVDFDTGVDGWVAQEYALLTVIVPAPTVTVASVAVTPTPDTVNVAGTVQLTATPKDSGGNPVAGQTITWASSNTAVATVSATGLATGVASGTATITATAGGTSGTASVTVRAAPTSWVIGARVQSSGVNVRSGPYASATLLGNQPAGALGTIIGGPITDVAGDGLIRWQVDFDSGVDGWAAQDYMTLLAPAAPAPTVASVAVTPKPAAVYTGKTVQLAAVAKDSGGTTLTTAPMTWLSRDTLKAKVSSSGLVSGLAAGTVYVLASSGSAKDSSAVTVALVPVASVTVAPATASLAPLATAQLSATLKDSSGATLTGRTITWSSSNAAAATVSASGLVTALAAGSATITASSGGKSGAATITVTSVTITHKGWYVAPNGTSGNAGSITAPWNMATALSGASGRVKAGDTVWVRGGTYYAPFRSTLVGTTAARIIVRAYPGERAIVDGVNTTSDNFIVAGSYTTIWGLEFTNTAPSRYTTIINHNYRANNIINNGPHNKYINLIVHDGGVAFYTYSSQADLEITGSIFYNNGWQATDRGHGHALYLKNDIGPVLAQDNIIFNQFGYGIHVYTNTGDGLLNNISLVGNVSFDNGSLSSTGTSANLGNLGQPLANNLGVIGNMTYFAPSLSGTNLTLGSGNGLTATTNYVVGGSGITQGSWTGAVISGNTVLSAAPASRATAVFVRPNAYEPGRANVIVYNWSGAASVLVDLSAVLAVGDQYVVRNVQNLFGAPVASGTFGGGSISLPMGGVTPPTPVGMSSSPAPKTGPYFDVFLVTKQ